MSNRPAKARKGTQSNTATSTSPAPRAVMMPKSCTGPTRLAISEPKPIMSVAIAPTTGHRSRARVCCMATTGSRPASRCRRYSTIRCVTVAIPTTVIIAESIAEAIVSLTLAIAKRPRVVHRAISTTANGTTTHRRLRKMSRSTPPASRPATVPSRLPSRCSMAKPSRIITGSPAITPPGNCWIVLRSRSIVSTGAPSAAANTQATATVRRSWPTT